MRLSLFHRAIKFFRATVSAGAHAGGSGATMGSSGNVRSVRMIVARRRRRVSFAGPALGLAAHIGVENLLVVDRQRGGLFLFGIAHARQGADKKRLGAGVARNCSVDQRLDQRLKLAAGALRVLARALSQPAPPAAPSEMSACASADRWGYRCGRAESAYERADACSRPPHCCRR